VAKRRPGAGVGRTASGTALVPVVSTVALVPLLADEFVERQIKQVAAVLWSTTTLLELRAPAASRPDKDADG